MSTSGSIPYRPDIDGLRAIAVLSVVLYHCDFSWIPGGFAGVDVFFVISGFLIGWIVSAEVERKEFSFVAFYLRRAKRILPALMGVMVVFVAAGLLLLTPDELRLYSRSAIAALAGASNILFYFSSDYFAPGSHFDPFLMTWSLGVEEQFYVFFPILLLALHRWAPTYTVATLGLLVAGSFAASAIITPVDPLAAFYLLPTRAWELGTGVLLSYVFRKRGTPTLPRAAANGVAFCGLVALGVTFTFFDEGTQFPGVAALLPIFGTVCLLCSASSDANRALALRPIRFLGQISYSWYLYHWLFIAFTRLVLPFDPDPSTLFWAALLSLGASVPSWRYIERPFRRMQTPRQGRALASYGAGATLCFGALFAIWVTWGFEARFEGRSFNVAHFQREEVNRDCIANYGVTTPHDGPDCISRDLPVRVALIGDSHANALQAALRETLAQEGEGLMSLAKASCPPLPMLSRSSGDRPNHAQECHEFTEAVMQRIASEDIETVVLTAYWGAVLQEDAPDAGFRWNGNSQPDDPRDALYIAVADLAQALVEMGKTVVVLGDVPEFRFDPLRSVAAESVPLRTKIGSEVSNGGPSPQELRHGAVSERVAVIDHSDLEVGLQEALRPVLGATFVALRHRICEEDVCVFKSPAGQPLYLDRHHVSKTGAHHVLAETLPFENSDVSLAVDSNL